MELQFVKDGVPHCLELMSTVQIHDETWLLNEDGFCSPPLPVVRDHLFHPGTSPNIVVVTLLHAHVQQYHSCPHLCSTIPSDHQESNRKA